MLASASLGAHAQSADPIVQTSLGKVEGTTDINKGVKEFKGIMFATANRFSMPIPVTRWIGVKDAKHFGSACPQAARYNLTEQSLNENCLSLNVTTPLHIKAKEKLPVLLWIHGGAFVGGGSNLYRLDKLSNQGHLVVVSINYRVGLFGFMPHPAMDPASNGDLGLEDQRVGMRWVQKNIAAFGGDPNNVTIAGESAGAGSICQHLASPEQVKGLFHKAILMSGACLQELPTLKNALDKSPIWDAVAKDTKDPNRKFSCPVPADSGYTAAASLQCLKNVSVENLLEAQTYEAGNQLLSFVPSTGNTTVPRSFKEAISSGKVVKVPIINGGAQNELRLYVAYDVLGSNGTKTKYPVNPEKVNAHYLPAFYGTDNGRFTLILKRYFKSASKPVHLNGATLGSMLSDYNPNFGINNCLYLKTANAYNGVKGMLPIYEYEFGDPAALVLGVGIAQGENPGFTLGAVHSAILNYFFPNLSNTNVIDAPDLPVASQQLANQMVAYFANFARTGKPFLAGQPAWPKYNGTHAQPSSPSVLFFTPSNIHTYTAYGDNNSSATNGHQCAYWDSVFPE